ncbi:hypothetical protein MLD38_030374 [Melastoma candidum]|uniref:Uncharacterized protein n=1 Tax=Melastoma candidum TaxID=119954 RepID=A0ACB9MN05_9MYRT|nr:hypothetical protein MLD38_030374 [Melastoma candidum]
MENLNLGFALAFAIGISLLLVFLRIVLSCWILPVLVRNELTRNGFRGPKPRFPTGNVTEIGRLRAASVPPAGSLKISHDIHSIAFPHFHLWQMTYGKVFVYWLGTEPFLYVTDPKFLQEMSLGTKGRGWGKPNVFRKDREPMFGSSLVMIDGDEWFHRRNILTPAFSPSNMKDMIRPMIESADRMLSRWAALINSGLEEIDVEKEITMTAGEIIAQSSFGISPTYGRPVLEKLRALQITLFKTNRFVGVPYGTFMYPKQTLMAKRLGKEIDDLLMTLIEERKRCHDDSVNMPKDLLGVLIRENKQGDCTTGNRSRNKKLTTRELVDECKTFFFGGHETTALALTWTLLLLAMHPEWQEQLREEITEVVGDGEIDETMLPALKKMGWVMNEVLRLYSPAPNVQRQAREDIRANRMTVPKGTNIWIDLVSMHRDRTLWGDDANEFNPERFKNDTCGGCKHRMGFLPFGFGGRMCIGRNFMVVEYKTLLTLILSRFSVSLSPSYRQCPSIMLSLRPAFGMPLVLRPLYTRSSKI